MLESQIRKETVTFLRAIGGAVYVTEQGYRKDPGGSRTTPGIPDLIVIFPTAWTFAELKGPKGRLRPSQEAFRAEAAAASIPWELWRDVTDAWDWCVRNGLITEARGV